MKPEFCQEVQGSEESFLRKTDLFVILGFGDPGGGAPDTLAVTFAGTCLSLSFSITLMNERGHY